MSFFDFNKVAQSYPLQDQAQARQMPMPYGGSQLAGTQFGGQQPQQQPFQMQGMQQGGMGMGQGMNRGMQSPYGGQALPGTQMPQIGQQQQPPMMQGVEGMTDIERRQLAEAEAVKSGKFADFGMQAGQGATAPALQTGGMNRLMGMSNAMGSGQQQRQPYQRMNTGIKGLL